MAIVYEKSRGLTDVEFHYCPGCNHGIIHKLVAESLVELGLLDDMQETLIKAEGLEFDAAYTSCLKRAIKTLFLTLEESDQLWIPVTKNWRLNERHYGALTGLNKQETVNKHGIEQVGGVLLCVADDGLFAC